jgi:hypothetical protein
MRILFVMIFLACFCCMQAQNLTLAQAQELYGPGTTISTSKTSDASMTETTTITYADKDGIVRRREETVKDVSGKTQHKKVTEHSLSGRITKSSYTTYPGGINAPINDEGNQLSSITETKEFDRKGRTTSHIVESEGWDYSDDRARSTSYDVMKGEGSKPSNDWKPYPITVWTVSDLPQNQNCIPKFSGFAGYSYLNADYGTERESYPLGFNISAGYNLGSKISLVADYSMHIKKDQDFKWTQLYVGVGAQYEFMDSEDCSKPVRPFANLMAGFYSDRFSYDGDKLYSECEFALMLGGGFNYMMNDRAGLRLQAHAIAPGIGKENSPVNFRISAGLMYAFSQPPKS